jgi:hypothetical protein
MRSNMSAFLTAAVLVVGIGIAPASAAGVLGGVLGGGGSDGGLVTIEEGEAGNDSLVNVGIGGENNNVLDVNLGANDPLANANVSAGLTDSGLVASTSVTLDLGGLGLDLDIDIGIPGPGGGGYVLVGSLGGGSFVIKCSVNDARNLLQVAANGKISNAEIKAWARATGVQIVPIKLCPTAKRQVAQIFARSSKVNTLQGAVVNDALIMATLSRSGYDASDVVAVQRRNTQLIVYVF